MKIIVIGDSTTAEYGEQSFPQQGWAHYLKDYFNDVQIINFACGGWTLKNFLFDSDYVSGKNNFNTPENSRWAKILSEIEPGDYVIFNWAGINDMGQICADSYREDENGEYLRDDFFTEREVFMNVGKGYGTHTFFTLRTTPDGTREILCAMINDLKEKGAIPIISKGTGKYYKLKGQEYNVFASNHAFADAIESAASKAEVCFVNVADKFEQGFEIMGYQSMIDKYFMSKNASEKFMDVVSNKKVTVTADDNVHYNIDGAKEVCRIFIEGLKNTDCSLKTYLK